MTITSTEWQARLVATVANLSLGEVVSYREVACRAGRPRAARSVGSFLSRHGDALPWWRVVHVDGRVAAHKAVEHTRRLRAEGIEVVGGRVVGATHIDSKSALHAVTSTAWTVLRRPSATAGVEAPWL